MNHQLVYVILSGLFLAVLGVMAFFWKASLSRREQELAVLQSKLEEREQKRADLEQEVHKLESKSEELNLELGKVKEELAKVRESYSKEIVHSKEKLKLLEEAEEKLTQQFSNLANKIFDEKTTKFAESSKQNMQALLNPLKERIKEFDDKVTRTHTADTKERGILLAEIDKLKKLNERIAEDAVNLTNALRGESKTQGAWGEVILERVLEMSGLQKGREYDVQASQRDEEGKLYRPDVIVHLPDDKDIVIDSKVSLTAYERFASEEDETRKEKALKEHVLSLKSHISQLSEKGYEQLKGVRTLNFVLMFVPIEAALLTVMDENMEILRLAHEKNIILVTPSTLLATLRTIQSIWQYEYMSRNAQTIAEEAGKLYDQFVMFVDELNKVGSSLEKASDAHHNAMKRLTSGRGNLVRRVENLRKLGAKNRKELSQVVKDEALPEEN